MSKWTSMQAIKNAQDSNKGRTEEEEKEEENSVSSESTTSLPGLESDLGRLVFSENEEGLHFVVVLPCWVGTSMHEAWSPCISVEFVWSSQCGAWRHCSTVYISIANFTRYMQPNVPIYDFLSPTPEQPVSRDEDCASSLLYRRKVHSMNLSQTVFTSRQHHHSTCRAVSVRGPS